MKGVIWLASGLILSLLLVSAISAGSQLSLPLKFYSVQSLKEINLNSTTALEQVDQLAAVSSTWDIVIDLLSPLMDRLKNFWFWLTGIWQKFLGLFSQPVSPPKITPELQEQIRQEVENFSTEIASTKYGIMVVPSSGSITRDEWLKKTLSQMFADQVDLKFDETGRSGVVTPIFRDGRRGGDYIFVLTPLR